MAGTVAGPIGIRYPSDYRLAPQHVIIDLYGRGLSLEGESPLMSRRRIGGPQPSIEHSPLLFDKVYYGGRITVVNGIL